MAADRIPLVPMPQGVAAPQLGLGTWQMEGETCERAVREALELGIRHIDTAAGYDNEEAVGRALRGFPREAVFLTTKVWRDELAPDDLRASCERSLRRLDTPYVDLLLVHWPNRAIPIAATVDAFLSLADEGRIRAWGVSNFGAHHLRDLLPLGRPATNQVELHPYFRDAAALDLCAARSIPVTAYSPLARGAVLDDPVLRAIGDAHGVGPAVVALRWNVQHGRLVIPKAADPRHLRENLRVFEFELRGEEMERIDALPQGARLFDFEWAEFEPAGS